MVLRRIVDLFNEKQGEYGIVDLFNEKQGEYGQI
jgi:hypothetical protein